jgi:ketosteroid isomerase-like protein
MDDARWEREYGESTMNRSAPMIFAVIAAAVCIVVLPARASSSDEAAIRALEAQFTKAFNAKDIDAIMKVYVPDDSLLVFDVVPPREYVGAKAYRKDWEGLFRTFRGPVKFELSELHVFVGGTIGYGYSIQHVSGTDTKGQPIDLTVRVTDGYRKVNGKWLIAHEHVSVPTNLETGKTDLTSKP